MSQIFQYSYFYFILICFIVFLYFITQYAFKNGYPTCDNYVVNVYLYLGMSICLIGLFAYILNILLWSNTKDRTTSMTINDIYQKLGMYYLGSVIVGFIFIIILSYRNLYSLNGHFLNHLLWICFLLCISIMLYPLFKDQKSYMYVDKAFLSASIIFICMSIVVYMYPSFFEKTYHFMMIGLFIGLIAVIIIEIVSIFFLSQNKNSNSENNYGWRKYITYFIIVLFSLFVSYDTITVFREAKSCVNYPNYPKSSLNFFLDILNLFSSLMSSYR